MKQIITKFDDEMGDFDVVTPVPFTLKDGIEYVGMMVADIPKYEDTKDYNVFELIRENQDLKKQLEDMTLCRDIASGHREEVQNREAILLNQQKEFIEWLQADLEALIMCDREFILTNNKKEIKAYSEILSKYKEIIGGKHE